MPKCVKIRRKHRQVCIGDLRDEVTLQDRALTPSNTSVDANEVFTENAIVFAMVETSQGETSFGGTDTEQDVTHKFTIRFLDGITAETWVNFNGDRFDILDTQDYEERHEYLVLRCTNRGIDTNRANDA